MPAPQTELSCLLGYYFKFVAGIKLKLGTDKLYSKDKTFVARTSKENARAFLKKGLFFVLAQIAPWRIQRVLIIYLTINK